MILEVSGINTYYGTSHILFDVALHMKRGELVCLLGRNGSGDAFSGTHGTAGRCALFRAATAPL